MDSSLRSALKDVFKFADYKSKLQEEAVKAVCEGTRKIFGHGALATLLFRKIWNARSTTVYF